jgi:hypothetical protein
MKIIITESTYYGLQHAANFVCHRYLGQRQSTQTNTVCTLKRKEKMLITDYIGPVTASTHSIHDQQNIIPWIQLVGNRWKGL